MQAHPPTRDPWFIQQRVGNLAQVVGRVVEPTPTNQLHVQTITICKLLLTICSQWMDG
jgi:hypothetical protein